LTRISLAGNVASTIISASLDAAMAVTSVLMVSVRSSTGASENFVVPTIVMHDVSARALSIVTKLFIIFCVLSYYYFK
jgi:CBS domain containing-hemolysin-like protein